MKISAAVSLLALGLAQADKQLETTFARALGQEQRILPYYDCCEWVCPEPEPEPEPEPCYYRSKAMMKGGSYYGDDCDDGYRSKAMMKGGYRRAKETTPATGADRELWGYPMPPYECSWDCSGCEPIGPPEPPIYPPGPGYQCFPTVTTPDACECTCCGHLPLPPPPMPEPEPEPEPCYYRSKAMMMGGSYYGGDDCDYYRSKAMMMGGYRRAKETTPAVAAQEQGERLLPYGPGIMCECECEEPEPIYRSKAMMKGSKKGGKGMKMSGSGYDDDYY